MLSRLSTGRTSRSLHSLHQNSCANGSHVLPQSLLGHCLSHTQPSSSLNLASFLRSVGECRKNLQRDDACKCFVRFLTDGRRTHPSAGSNELQIEMPGQSEAKEDTEKDGEVKRKGQGGALRRTLATIRSREQAASEYKRPSWNCARVRSSPILSITDHPTEPAGREDIAYTEKNDGDPSAETSKKLKVIEGASKRYAEVHSVVIMRKITKKFLQQLQQKIDFLHAGPVRISQVKILLKKRAFLSTPPEKLLTVVELLAEFFKSKSIAFDVLTANAGILERPIDNLEQRLLLLAKFEVDRNACIKLGTSVGMWTLQLRHYEENLSFFKGLGMDAHAISLMLQRRPILLRQNEASMRATVEFFESIGLCRSKLLKLLVLRPELLGSSVDKNLMVKFKLFQDWGFTLNDYIRALRYLSQHSTEQIGLRYEFLRQQGLSHEAVTRVLRMQPSVLALSAEDVKTKLNHLFHVLNRDVSELEKFPAYLGYSFKGRILPRFKALEEVGLRKRPCLSRVLSTTTSVFKTRYNISNSVKCSDP